MRPALYVGLGGAGTWTVAKIKKRILERENETGIKFPNAYLVLDTDEGTISNVKKALGYNIIDDVTETVIYGKTCNPRAEYEQMLKYQRQNNTSVGSVYRSMTKWIDEKVATTFPNQSLQKGASAERQKGRVGGLMSSKEIMNKLRERMKTATQLMFQYIQKNPKEGGKDFSFPIYLISSCLGGSGSSMFLDTCKMISLVYRDVVSQGRGGGEADIQPIIYLPDPYLEKYAQGTEDLLYRYKANAFAFFSEIDFFFHDRYFGNKEPGKEGKRIYDLYFNSEEEYFKSRNDVSWQPFKAGILVDSQLLGAQLSDISQMYDLVSEMMAQLCTTPTAYNAIQSKFDNQKGQIGSKPYSEAETELQLARAYATMGYRVLEFPKEPMRKYFISRFLRDSFDGLIGKDYNQIENSEFRETQVRNNLEKLERFIYAELTNKSDMLEIGANKEPHNFEAAITQVIKPFIEDFTTERFWTEKALDKGEEDFDKKKVNDTELSEHFREATEIVRKFRTNANAQILEGTGDNSRKGIISALERELDKIFIDNIITFGVTYTSRLLERIDSSLENKLTRAIAEIQVIRSRQERERGEINSLKEKVLEALEKLGGKWKEELRNYHAAVTRLIDCSKQEYLLEARIKLLKYLCEGEDGLLDSYERQATALQNLLNAYYEGNSTREGFRRQFENTLLKAFEETARLPTVQYLPNISDYVTETGEWKEDILLARLYERFVNVEKKPGEAKKQPIRYYTDELPDTNQRDIPKERLPSLAQQLRKILNQFGRESFMKLVQSDIDASRQEKLMEEWIAHSKSHVEEWMSDDKEVTAELNKPLIQRFNDLSQEEQQNVSHLFKTLLAPLCPHNRMNDNPNRVIAIASDNKAFAERIYPNNGSVEYPQDPTLKNKVVGFILESGFTRNDFEQIMALIGIYHGYREEFRPHLWKVANEFGIKGLMGDFSQDVSLDWVADALTYNFLITNKLTADQKATIFFKDAQTGENEPVERGPIYIERDKGKNTNQFFYLTTFEEKNGKLLIRKKFYEPLTTAKNFFDYAELLTEARRKKFNQDILKRLRDSFANLITHSHFSIDDIHNWVENDYRRNILEQRIQESRSRNEKAQVEAVTKISNRIHERLQELFPKALSSTASDGVESVVG
ncbi:MAG: tubulin-like doman-containing protein [Chloroherpetonaceae bacterium]